MKKIVVYGLVNRETNIYVGDFPINYSPIEFNFFGNKTSLSGVGLNLAMSFASLETPSLLVSSVGNDAIKEEVEAFLKSKEISYHFYPCLKETPESVVLFDREGKRKIYCDLKDVQEVELPTNEAFESDLAILCNTNFARKFLDIYQKLGVKIATDCHVIGDVSDPYNKDFMLKSDILFMSDENIRENAFEFMKDLIKAYDKEIIVISRGAKGVLMYVQKDQRIVELDSYKVENVKNTIGAGDALFSCFNAFYLENKDPYTSIQLAMKYAAKKIQSSGGALGFPSRKELLEEEE